MDIQQIEFSPWYGWNERNEITDSQRPGVYLLIKYSEHKPGKVNPLDQNIIYIGETCSSLRKRWYQFKRSAFDNKRAHSGGSNYREIYHDNGENLYVAAFPVSCSSDTLTSSYIRYLERKLIFNYVQKYKQLPKCNKK